MTDIIFSFDTEDFTSPDGAEAILTEAEILRKHDVKGCFCLVGLLARQLKNWERTDVLEALKHHEIDLHTYGHSLHPMINEYTDIEDFEKAKAEVIRQESEAVRIIKEITGTDRIYAAVPPGNSKSYAAMYAYAEMGIPVYADTFCDPEDGRGSYYCNIFHTDYSLCMEGLLFECSETEIKAELDRLSKRKTAVIYTHPQMSLFEEFWDVLNYDKENCPEFGNWKECRKRTKEQSYRFYKNLDVLLTILKNDRRFRITTYKELAERISAEPVRIIKKEDIPQIKRQISKNFFPLTNPGSYSLSDIFLACKEMLCGSKYHICGNVYGFLSMPLSVKESQTFSAEEIVKSCNGINSDTFLPESISVSGTEIGPAEWLKAALDILSGEKETTVVPTEQLPCLDILPQVRDCSFKGTWRHSDSFEDRYLSDRLRLQSWTMRFPSVEGN